MTSLLRPGLHIVRRDERHLQVGVDPPWRVVLPDHPDVRRLLGDLAAGRTPAPEGPEGRRALADLAEAGMLAPPAPARPGVALAGTAAPPLAGRIEELLRAAGCPVDPSAGVALLAWAGEVPRHRADAELAAGRPHLLLGAHSHGWTLGPFVAPGRTACLRCVDAHRGERDPRRALVVEQLAGLHAAPPDPVLAALAAAWAVRDLLTYLEGGEPATWSATVDLGPPLPPEPCRWARHPHCGCSWGELTDASA